VSDRPEQPERDRLAWAKRALGGAAVVAVALLIIGLAATAPQKRADLWFETAKAGLQLGVIVIAGALVGYAIRYLEAEREAQRRREEAEREERRRLDGYRQGLARELVDAYNDVKAVRRTLRACGFRPDDAGVVMLTADQVTEFNEQMSSLMRAQLSLERIKREIRAEDRVFGADTPDLVKKLGDAESYVNHVIEDWEMSGTKVSVGEDAYFVMRDHLKQLQGFLAPAKGPDSKFKCSLSRPLDDTAEILRQHHLAGRIVGTVPGTG
jgi:hypothetical protein